MVEGGDCPTMPGAGVAPLSAVWSLGVPHYTKDIRLLEWVQGKEIRVVKILQDKTYEKWLRSLGVSWLEKRKQRGELTAVYSFLTGMGTWAGELQMGH